MSRRYKNLVLFKNTCNLTWTISINTQVKYPAYYISCSFLYNPMVLIIRVFYP